MLYKDAKRCAKAYIKFARQHFYNDPEDFKAKFSTRFPATDIEIIQSNSPIDRTRGIIFLATPYGEDKPIIEFRLHIPITALRLWDSPELDFLNIEGCDDKIEPPAEECNLEIQAAIEGRILELKRFGFSDEDVSEAMLDVIQTLVSPWTLPDDREEILN